MFLFYIPIDKHKNIQHFYFLLSVHNYIILRNLITIVGPFWWRQIVLNNLHDKITHPVKPALIDLHLTENAINIIHFLTILTYYVTSHNIFQLRSIKKKKNKF